MNVIGTKERKSKNSVGETKNYNLRRLRCKSCRKIHHELPDFLIPYKRYEAACIESVLTNPDLHDVPADESTLIRWSSWFKRFVDYWIGCLISIMLRTNQDITTVNVTSISSQPALHRIGRLVGDASNWLMRIVRPIVNFNLWVHTRSAYLSDSS